MLALSPCSFCGNLTQNTSLQQLGVLSSYCSWKLSQCFSAPFPTTSVSYPLLEILVQKLFIEGLSGINAFFWWKKADEASLRPAHLVADSPGSASVFILINISCKHIYWALGLAGSWLLSVSSYSMQFYPPHWSASPSKTFSILNCCFSYAI